MGEPDKLQEFIYAVSHDFGAPVRHIKGLANMLLDSMQGEYNDDQLRYQHLMLTAVSDLENKLAGLLEYSRLASQCGPEKRISLAEPFQQASEKLRGDIPQFQAAKLVIEGEWPQLTIHPAIITSMFYQLLRNAAEHIDPTSTLIITITIDKDNGQWRFTITDNGMGTNVYNKENLFDLFAKGSTDKDHAGLGLSIAKRAIELHGGTIALNPEHNYKMGFSVIFSLLDY